MNAEVGEDSAGRARAARLDQAVLVAAVLLVLLPVGIDLVLGGLRHVFDYLASDAYYYFVVGRNIAATGRVSFDGALPTNGFHPVWQALVAAAFLVGRIFGLADLSVVSALLGLCALLIAGGLWALGRGLLVIEGRLGWPFATLPVGAYALMVLPLWLADAHVTYPVYGTLFSYVNGMESATVLCAYGLCARWFLGGRALSDDRGALVQGLLLALLTLCRLDTIFLAGGALLALLGLAWSSGERAAVRRVLRCALSFAVPIAIYLVVNRLYAGTALPISGKIKSTLPYIHARNWQRLFDSLRAPAEQSLYRMYRLAQLVLPALAAIAQLALALRPSSDLRRALEGGRARLEAWLCATALGVLLVSLYDLCFVELAEHGPWYHPLGTLFFSLWVALGLDRGWTRRVPSRRRPLVSAAALVLVVAFSLVFFVRQGRAVGANRVSARFYFDVAPRLRAFYGERRPRFIEVDDGLFSFATGYQALSGKGFSLDLAGAEALRLGELVPLGLERGYDRVTSVLYMNTTGYDITDPSARICQLIRGITPEALCDRYTYSIEYMHEHFVVVRVEPLDPLRGAGTPPPN